MSKLDSALDRLERACIGACFILLISLGIAACTATPPVDPDNGVSTADYRSALVRVQKNLANLTPKLDRALARDPTLSPAQRQADLGLATDTAALISDTLAGKNVGAPPK